MTIMFEPDTLARFAMQEFGFSNAGPLDPHTIRLRPEVRQMCAADRCQKFGRNWSCPPAIGSLTQIADRLKAYNSGVLLQSTAQLEDDFDIDTMLQAETDHKAALWRLAEHLREQAWEILPMPAGSCTYCEVCTFPSAPCRFPQRMTPSLEAAGVVVSDLCSDNGLPYYYGPLTITYTSAILFTR